MSRLPTFLSGVVSGAIPALMLVAFYILSQPVAVWPLPLDWVTDTFPQNVEVCPGDTVPYKLGIWEKVEGPIVLYDTVDRGPNHPAVEEVRQTGLAQALMSEYEGQLVGDTVVVEKSPTWIILGGDEEHEVSMWGNRLRVDIDSSVTIPENLDSGPYIRKLAVLLEGRPSAPAIRVQRFTVKPKGDCDATGGSNAN